MKVRKGFVSNSSSSSYVVLLPSDLKVSEELQPLLDRLITTRELWLEEVEEGEYDLYYELVERLDPYIIDVIEMGPDASHLTIADMNKVKEILA